MWNPFKKKKPVADTDDNQTVAPIADTDDQKAPEDQPATPKMGIIGKLAMKKLARMSPKEQQKMMQEAMDPKNKDKMMAAMEQMRKAGMISEEQYRMAKEKFGL